MNLLLPKLHIQLERWKWSKKYQVYVSNLGNFKNANKESLHINVDNGGYCRIKTIEGQRLAHRVVMETWKPNKKSDVLTVDHLNHNKRDNSLYNLEWCSKEENVTRAKQDLINLKDKMVLSTTTFIKCDKQTFESYEAAAHYCMQICGMREEARIDTVIRHIKKAIMKNTKYANQKWSFVEI